MAPKVQTVCKEAPNWVKMCCVGESESVHLRKTGLWALPEEVLIAVDRLLDSRVQTTNSIQQVRVTGSAILLKGFNFGERTKVPPKTQVDNNQHSTLLFMLGFRFYLVHVSPTHEAFHQQPSRKHSFSIGKGTIVGGFRGREVKSILV